MQEDIAVYEALRAHILQKECQIANETIYMYVSYFALLAIGSIWNDWISLLPFLVLIVFQSMINEEEWEICKASMYIKTFFEKQRKDIHWESLHEFQSYSLVFSNIIHKTIGWYISKCSAIILSVLSFVCILLPILHNYNYQILNVSFAPTARIIFAGLLMTVTIWINRKFFSIRENEKLKSKLAEAIKEFYETQ